MRAGQPLTAPVTPSTPVPLTPIQRATARRLVAHSQAIVPVTFTATVDVTRLGERARPPYTAASVKAVALGLERHPRLAMEWTDEGLLALSPDEVGVAVAVADGILVPVVRRVRERGVDDLADEIAELAIAARERRLTRAAQQGGAFTVSSLGRWRVEAFTPIVNPPQAGILGVGQARTQPYVVGDEVMARRCLTLSLTVDHRVVDGAPAAAFLTTIADLLENPASLMASGHGPSTREVAQ